jgi:hypothetical protein
MTPEDFKKVIEVIEAKPKKNAYDEALLEALK